MRLDYVYYTDLENEWEKDTQRLLAVRGWMFENENERSTMWRRPGCGWESESREVRMEKEESPSNHIPSPCAYPRVGGLPHHAELVCLAALLAAQLAALQAEKLMLAHGASRVKNVAVEKRRPKFALRVSSSL